MCKVYVIINAGGQPVSKKGTGIVHCTAAAMNWRADVTSWRYILCMIWFVGWDSCIQEDIMAGVPQTLWLTKDCKYTQVNAMLLKPK